MARSPSMAAGSSGSSLFGIPQIPQVGSCCAHARSPLATQFAALSSQCRRFSTTWSGRSAVRSAARHRCDRSEKPEPDGSGFRGAKGNRTLGLDSAIVALYQLSYSPKVRGDCIAVSGSRTDCTAGRGPWPVYCGWYCSSVLIQRRSSPTCSRWRSCASRYT